MLEDPTCIPIYGLNCGEAKFTRVLLVYARSKFYLVAVAIPGEEVHPQSHVSSSSPRGVRDLHWGLRLGCRYLPVFAQGFPPTVARICTSVLGRTNSNFKQAGLS